MKNFFKTKGYYVIIVACVIAICAAGVAIINKNANTAKDPTLAYHTPSPKPAYNPGGATKAPAGTPPTTGSGIENTPSGTAPTKDPDSDVSKPVTPAPSDGTPAPVKMEAPVAGTIVTDFAAKKLVYNQTLQEWRTHPAIDIKAEAGAEIKSAYKGTVSSIKNDPRYGLTVIIDHGSNLQTVYCGLAAAAVESGAAVETGTVLGTVGADMFCEKDLGAHLHFEVILDGAAVDPNQYITFQ